jgi:uncharacterized protein YfkK (UPF0435 family)
MKKKKKYNLHQKKRLKINLICPKNLYNFIKKKENFRPNKRTALFKEIFRQFK